MNNIDSSKHAHDIKACIQLLCHAYNQGVTLTYEEISQELRLTEPVSARFYPLKVALDELLESDAMAFKCIPGLGYEPIKQNLAMHSATRRIKRVSSQADKLQIELDADYARCESPEQVQFNTLARSIHTGLTMVVHESQRFLSEAPKLQPAKLPQHDLNQFKALCAKAKA